MTIIFLLEERSMKEVLDIILPKILPADVCFKTIPHSGKSDLQESIPRKLKAWRQPDVKFVIVQDQDSGDCVKIKEFLKGLAEPSGREALIRIACRELEAWYLGDLNAVSLAYGRDVRALAAKRKFRMPDQLGNPKEELRKLFPAHQQLDGARRIAVHMDVENNASVSFRQFVSGVRRLCGEGNNDRPEVIRNDMGRIGSLEGQDLIDPDYDIDACNDEIAEMFGVNDL